jgi:EmrB/QacA subfamily drug resistance transporter
MVELLAGRSSRRNSKVLPFIVAATYFMESLDTTVVATALPQMAHSFSVGPNEVSIGMTAYMLTLAVLIPISAWIADRHGARTVFGSAVFIFTIASVLCGSAQSTFSFTVARVLQGMGGAMMVPVGRMIVARNTDQDHMLRAISTITWPAIVAPVIGPTVGGLLTTYASWRWAFYLNVPFGIAALVAIAAFVPNKIGPSVQRLDFKGLLLVGVTLVSLLYGMELASRSDISIVHAGSIIGAGIAFGLLAVGHLRTTAQPILNLQVFRMRTYTTSVWWGGFARAGIEAVPYLSPLLFQIGFGLSAFQAGLLLLVTAIGNLGIKVFVTSIIRHFGFRTVAICNGTAVALTILGFAWLTPSTPWLALFVVLFAYGLSRSLQLSTMTTLSYADISEELKSSASTIWSTMQQMTTGLGIAFGAVCLHLASLLRAPEDLTSDNGFAITDFHWAFTIASLLTLLPTITYWRLPRNAGRSII